MLIDQDEINALLSEAGDLSQGPSRPKAAESRELSLPNQPELQRILKIRVPVIVQLASRHMTVSKIRNFATGSIVEFDKGVDEPLSLMINNRLIGKGSAVKVGEFFGLKIDDISDVIERIRSLGR